MEWNLANIAMMSEIVGMFAIVASLIFVGVQISSSNREARAATLQTAMNTEIALAADFATHAETWNNVLTGAPFSSGAEARKGIILYNIVMTESESRYHQYQAGYLEHGNWEARRSVLPQLVNLPVFAAWRTSPGGLSHTEEFLNLLDDMVVENSS